MCLPAYFTKIKNTLKKINQYQPDKFKVVKLFFLYSWWLAASGPILLNR